MVGDDGDDGDDDDRGRLREKHPKVIRNKQNPINQYQYRQIHHRARQPAAVESHCYRREIGE